MARIMKRISRKAGLKPGALVYVGNQENGKAVVDLVDYTKTDYHETENLTPEECVKFAKADSSTWIDVVGVHDVAVVEKIGNALGLHQLTMEDILNTGTRPKMEEADGHLFTALKMISIDPDTDVLDSEHVSIITGPGYVVTFQEKDGDVFARIRDRVKNTVPRTRFMDSDYLTYSLIDIIVDHYFIVLEHFSERIQDLEENLIKLPKTEDLQDILSMKRELLYLRRVIWPVRELANALIHSESPLIHKSTGIYLRDLYDHVVQVLDSIDTFREMVSGLLDIYLSSVSNRMNEVMKVLTIIATIFIPLGFLAGVYGMNFDTHASPFNMPELGARFGYPFFWLASLVIAGLLFYFFRRKQWL